MSERHLNFDEIINRKNHNDLKYDFHQQRNIPTDALPLWVADMDFKVSSYITDAIKKQAEYAIYGYSEANDSYYDVLNHWFERHFNFHVEKEWVIKNPSIVYTLAMCIQAFTNEGDAVLIQQPVYYPFSEVITDNNRIIVDNTLKLVNDHYEIDFEDFEQKIIDSHVKLFLLCNPHNPTGRVFTKEELEKMGDICIKHNVLIISDEIHSVFTWGSHQHICFPSIKESFKDHCIVCTSPSKAFNIAALHIANVIIPNKEIRETFKKAVTASGYSQLNGVGLIACEAAYQDGDEWLDGCLNYIEENIQYTIDYIHKNLPQLRVIEPEGTYLVWIDCKNLGLSVDELDDLVLNKAHLWLDSGKIFGVSGQYFQRINVATPRSILKQALDQLKNAIEQNKKS